MLGGFLRLINVSERLSVYHTLSEFRPTDKPALHRVGT